jgi:hypothetical protein
MTTGAAPPCSSAQRVPGASRDRRYQPSRLHVGHYRLAPRFLEACLAGELDKAQARQRGRLCRLHDHGAPGGDRRCHLVRDKIERMIERADRHHRADRLARGERSAPDTCRRQIHRDLRAPQILELACRDGHARHSPVGFNARVRKRLAALPCDEQRELVAFRLQPAREVAENVQPLVRRQPRRPVLVQPHRPVEPVVDLAPRTERYLVDGCAIEGLVDGQGSGRGAHGALSPLPSRSQVSDRSSSINTRWFSP